jgi:hypothetical protein
MKVVYCYYFFHKHVFHSLGQFIKYWKFWKACEQNATWKGSALPIWKLVWGIQLPNQINWTYVCLKITVFWTVMSCSLIERYQHYGGTCCLHLQHRRVYSLTLTMEALTLFYYITWHHIPGDSMFKVTAVILCECLLYCQNSSEITV